jgi:hypothetical protein
MQAFPDADRSRGPFFPNIRGPAHVLAFDDDPGRRTKLKREERSWAGMTVRPAFIGDRARLSATCLRSIA